MVSLFSFFSGSGFLDLGFEVENFNIVLVNEYNDKFLEAYQYARRHMGIEEPEFGYSKDVNDFLGVRQAELEGYIAQKRDEGDLIGFIGGPPCPDFSVAGKQKGRDGDNGKLSLSYVQLIINQQPDFFLFENVKGLWRTAKHRAYYDDLKAMLADAGYLMTDRLTNALEFEAPQDRDRILLFGIKHELLPDKDELSDFPWTAFMTRTLNEVKMMPWPTVDDFVADGERECPEGIPRDMTVEYWFELNDVYNHVNARDHFTPRQGLVRMETIQEGDVSKKSYKRLHRWRYSPTVAYGNNEVHLHPYKIRRISAAEALSLQTLPKEFVLPPDMPLSAKFKTIGNGVPFIMARGIARTIHLYLERCGLV